MTVVSNDIVSTLSITSQMNGNCGPGVYTNETKVEMIGPIVYYRAKETNEKHEFEAVRFS